MSGKVYLSTLLVDFIDGLNGVEMINTGVKTDLVQDNNTGSLDLSVELPHGWGDVAGGDDVGFALDRRLDDLSMVCVGNERDDEIVSGHGSL